MRKVDLLQAFSALGARCRQPTEIVIAGGSALLLADLADRETGDGDAIASRPKLSSLASAIAAVAEELDLPPDWLNDAVRAHYDLLPPDYHTRLVRIGVFDQLRVLALGRTDLILMKMAAARPRDLEDLRVLAPTPEEIRFVEAQLERINRTQPRNALRIQLYLDQYRSPEAPGSSPPHESV